MHVWMHGRMKTISSRSLSIGIKNFGTSESLGSMRINYAGIIWMGGIWPKRQ